MSNLTEQDVHDAARSLIREGKPAGIEAVARVLGRGSRTTMHKHLQTFWRTLGDSLAIASTPTLPAEISDLAEALWTRACAVAQAAADARLQAREDKAAALEMRAAEAISEARRVAASATAEAVAAQSARAAAENRADAAVARVREKTEALAEALQARLLADGDNAHARERMLQLERHLKDVEGAHAAALREIKEAHEAELSRLQSGHDREIDGVRVALDGERTRAAGLAKEATQREKRLQDDVAAARKDQLAAATSEARSRAELEQVAAQHQSNVIELERRGARIEQLERAVEALTAEVGTHRQSLAAQADWISPARLRAALKAGLGQSKKSAGVDIEAVLSSIAQQSGKSG